MEILSVEFFSALAAIVVIDLVLAGDNAIVIALAARNLPPHLQRRAIFWGTAGAILVRSTLTLAVVWLLSIPGLRLAGGLMLVWIAYRLLVPEEEGEAGQASGVSQGFWGALRTIVIADTVMGLDNVLGVAGAAHGSFLLVVLGLLISIPIMIWGSTMVLRFIERFPGFVYAGAGVLAWTAAAMIIEEPLLEHAFAAEPLARLLLYVVAVAGVLWMGARIGHRQASSRIDGLSRPLPAQASGALSVLLPSDGSESSLLAARHVVAQFAAQATAQVTDHPAVTVHLLNVQPPFSRHIASLVSRGDRDRYHRARGERALAGARDVLQRGGLAAGVHVEVGRKAELIAEAAARLGCHHIVMGTARRDSLTRMLQDSVTRRVLDLSTVPVEVITSDAVPRAERYGVAGAAVAVLAAVTAMVMT